jgi:hypothetical protein
MAMHASGGPRRRPAALGVAIGLATAAALATLAVPLATGQGGPSPIPEGCQLRSPQPAAPLKLNLVAVGGFVKAIAMQKEVFNCFDSKSTLASIKDVETFVELVGQPESGKDPGVKSVAKRVAAITCTKDFRTGGVACGSKPIQLGNAGVPLAGCSPIRGTYPFEPVEQPAHPVEMSTVALKKGRAHTVKVEKEVLDCGGRIGDVYLFAEIHQVAEKGKTLRPVSTVFSGVICLKDPVRATVVGCKLFTPKRVD